MELAQTHSEAPQTKAREVLIDFETPSGCAEYARLVPAGFDDGCQVSLQFNLARYLNPEVPVAQRSRDVVTTRSWDSAERRWRRQQD